MSSPDQEERVCHLVEGAECRIELVKIRTDRILICLSQLCRHTDVKGKRRGMWWGAGGYQAFTSERVRKKGKGKIYQLIASPQFLSTFFICFTVKGIYFVKVNKK